MPPARLRCRRRGSASSACSVPPVPDPLAISQSGPVVRVRMTRPDRRNAFDAALIAALTDAFHDVSTRPGARVVVLEGEGKSFSAGADLDWMRGGLDLGET